MELRHLISIHIIALVAITGCVSAPSPTGEAAPVAQSTDETVPQLAEEVGLSFEELEQRIQLIIPGCKLETIRAENGTYFDPETGDGWQYLNVVPLLDIFSGEKWKSSEGDQPRTELLDSGGFATFATCHSRGRSIEDRASLGRDFSNFDAAGEPKPDFPNFRNLGQCDWLWKKEVPADFVQSCLDKMAWEDNQGFAVIIREHSSIEQAALHVDRVSELSGGRNDRPIFASDRFTFMFQGPFNVMSDAGFSEASNLWIKLREEFSDSYSPSGIPSDFEGWASSGITKGFPNVRDRYREWRTVYGPTSSCSQPLAVSEFQWTPLQCGQAKVRVFQADLSTGSCAFLGYYPDNNGSEKIGYFEFCSSFGEGAFTEGTYDLRVRVTGKTSYQTRGGWENDVLAFEVVG